MKEKEFDRKDGTKGIEYSPEVGETFEVLADRVFERENLGIVNGKPVKMMKYGIQVLDKDNKEVFLVITGGQAKLLKKETESLKGKKIVFASYDHKDYGVQLGVRLIK